MNKKRESCLWIIPARCAVLFISFIVTIISMALLALTFLNKNPMIIHLSVVGQVFPWIYILTLAGSAGIGLFGIMATIADNHGIMALYKIMFWFLTFFVVYIWQILSFILALVNREKTVESCDMSNPDQILNLSNDNLSIRGYPTVFLHLKLGDTYGLANCDQAAQAGIIGIAFSLFMGGIFMFWFALVINRCTRGLNSNLIRSEIIDAHWDDHLDELQSSYARDRMKTHRYQLNKMNEGNKFSREAMKMKMNQLKT
ncbi:hypothetical protein BDB01DRAFT_901428 [Pilobolus umbonatus]|nr:hypothetical protein BDB01DRAFT_901428 [Pilobolus umbonatus]